MADADRRQTRRSGEFRNDEEVMEYLLSLDDSDVELSDLDDDDEYMPGNTTYLNSDIEGNEEDSSVTSSDEDATEVINNRETWRRRNFMAPNLQNLHHYQEISSQGWTCLDYFLQYIDLSMFTLISEKTNQTYTLLYGKSLATTAAEIMIWFGVTMMMACLQYPIIRMYWQKQWEIRIIAEAMTKDRYFQLRKSLKVVFDSDIPENERQKDRLWKVRPFLEKVRGGCFLQPRSHHIAVDEMMVPFQGHCGFKQYVRGKPNPVGIKVFVLANPNGTVCDFVCYQGKTSFPQELLVHGVSTASILLLTRSLRPGHIIYHDRFFTSVKLADLLLEKGFGSTGTIMNNRIPKQLRLKPDKDLQKEGRGSCDMLVRNDQKLAVTKWMDNKSVAMLSTAQGIEPRDTCQRWSKKERKYLHIERPSVIKNYNQNMGGVDMADRLNSYCPMRARTKKWTIRTICCSL